MILNVWSAERETRGSIIILLPTLKLAVLMVASCKRAG